MRTAIERNRRSKRKRESACVCACASTCAGEDVYAFVCLFVCPPALRAHVRILQDETTSNEKKKKKQKEIER